MSAEPPDITAALALCEAATPGEWTFDIPAPPAGATKVHSPASRADVDTMPVCDWIRIEDAQFIAAARTGWPAALREVQRLTALCDVTMQGKVRELTAERDSLRAALDGSMKGAAHLRVENDRLARELDRHESDPYYVGLLAERDEAIETNRTLSTDLEQLNKNYLDVADALLPFSTGSADLIAKVHSLRASAEAWEKRANEERIEVERERDAARSECERLAIARSPVDPSSYSLAEAEHIIIEHHKGMATVARLDSLVRLGYEDLRIERAALKSAHKDWMDARDLAASLSARVLELGKERDVLKADAVRLNANIMALAEDSAQWLAIADKARDAAIARAEKAEGERDCLQIGIAQMERNMNDKAAAFLVDAANRRASTIVDTVERIAAFLNEWDPSLAECIALVPEFWTVRDTDVADSESIVRHLTPSITNSMLLVMAAIRSGSWRTAAEGGGV